MCQSHGTDVYERSVRCDVLRPFVSSLVLSPGFATAIRISSPFPSTPAGPAECAPLGAQGPTHMFALPTLLAVYPDALFVQTHRAPLDAMASVSSLITILRRVFSDAVDPLTVCLEAIDYWSKTLERFLGERDRLADDRICDVNYIEIR